MHEFDTTSTQHVLCCCGWPIRDSQEVHAALCSGMMPVVVECPTEVLEFLHSLIELPDSHSCCCAYIAGTLSSTILQVLADLYKVVIRAQLPSLTDVYKCAPGSRSWMVVYTHTKHVHTQ